MTAARSEQPVTFACGGESLFGIVSQCADAAPTGVVIVVGGPQYRAGSHRQFVLLARALAAAGFPVLRFDVRGMGDSSGPQRSFESLDDDVAAAIDALQSTAPTVEHVVLWGLCDGASASLLYVHRRPDPRIAGLVLVNPWVRSEASLARTHVRHYYTRRLLEFGFWAKLLRGGIGPAALSNLVRSLRTMVLGGAVTSAVATKSDLPFQQRMAEAWSRFGGEILLLISENDLTAREFVDATKNDAQWRRALTRNQARRIDLAGADHTCSNPVAATAAEEATLNWLRALAGSPAASGETMATLPA